MIEDDDLLWIVNEGLPELRNISPKAAKAWELKEIDGRSLDEIKQELQIVKNEQLGELLRFAWNFLYWDRQTCLMNNVSSKYVAVLVGETPTRRERV